ncbi:MAG: T9SS type A sorting domain-containing protein [Bacteroidetes bacterium]|nr:T9SS type A sorting domain-containing protein [Bacteroidota bacterium]
MKKQAILLFIFCLETCIFISAQTNSQGFFMAPLKSGNNPSYANDILINNQPTQNQRDGAICSAFNGWLFAVHSHNISGFAGFAVLKSSDNGLTWTVIGDANSPLIDTKWSQFDIIACGNTIDVLKVFVSFIETDSLAGGSQVYLNKFDGLTGNWEGLIFDESSSYFKYHAALCSDYLHPAANSNPYNVGILYSKSISSSTHKDSVIFLSSSDGGNSFNNKQVLATSLKTFNKVAITFGFCPAGNTGRYFASWEEMDLLNSQYGHIYTSHSNPDINSPFTPKKCLDSLSATSINLCRNPSISCQISDLNNDSTNLTEVVLFEKHLPAANSNDIIGYYNQQALVSSFFKLTSIATSQNNESQPNIAYNSFENKFIGTYFDSTSLKLPLVENDINLSNPTNWNIISNGYNDSPNLRVPYPKVSYNPDKKQMLNLWIAESAAGNGEAFFDAEYHYYTGIPENTRSNNAINVKIYPNPCNDDLTIEFELTKRERVSIRLVTMLGETLTTFTDKNYEEGRNKVQADISKIPCGTYLYIFQSDNDLISNKLLIFR